MPRGKRIGAFVLTSWCFCWSVFEVCRKGAFMCTVNGILIETGKIKMHFPETIHLIQGAVVGGAIILLGLPVHSLTL